MFSSLTVGLSMAAMLVFPFYFLRSFAYAGMAVLAVASLGAVTVLPALIALLGRRVDAWDIRPLLRRAAHIRPRRVDAEQKGGFWGRLALAVMRRPFVFGGAVVVVLVILVSPFLSVRFGLPDDRVLPPSASARQVGNELRADFSQSAASSITVVLPRLGHVAPSALSAYAARLSSLPRVTEVVSPEGTYIAGQHRAALSTPVVAGGTYLTVDNGLNPNSAEGAALVRAVRHLPAPVTELSTGPAARDIDSLNGLGGGLPLALMLVALSTVVVLFVFTRSLLMPLKALVLNVLSLSATFGAMVWVFQDGHLSRLLGGVNAVGYLNASMPVLMFCIAFGLSMDYEVFLLSRVKEEWDRSDHTAAANRAAVATGLARTGRIITAAAVLISIVFVAIGTSQISFIKMFGVGMALAVIMDATLVRGVLVPSFMRLGGRANWWAPRWMGSRALSKGDIRGHGREYDIPAA